MFSPANPAASLSLQKCPLRELFPFNEQQNKLKRLKHYLWIKVDMKDWRDASSSVNSLHLCHRSTQERENAFHCARMLQTRYFYKNKYQDLTQLGRRLKGKSFSGVNSSFTYYQLCFFPPLVRSNSLLILKNLPSFMI